MRTHATSFAIGAAMLTIGFCAADGAAQTADRNVPVPNQASAAPAACPAGSHWVEPGYARHGKWRPGHCAPGAAAR
jgi:hypothetical protein